MTISPPKGDARQLLFSLLGCAAAANDMESLPFLISMGANIQALKITCDFSEEMVACVKKLKEPSTEEVKERKEGRKQIMRAVKERSLVEKIKQYKRKAYIAKKGEIVKYDIKNLRYEKKSLLGVVTAGMSEGSWPSLDGGLLMPVLQFSKDDLPNFAEIFGDNIELAAFYSPPIAEHDKGGMDFYFELHLHEHLANSHVIPELAPREKKARSIKWKEVDDYPSMECWEQFFSEKLLQEIQEVSQLARELRKKTGLEIDVRDLLEPQKNRHYGTKVGGYPDIIQNETQFPTEGEWEFLFQVDEKDFDTLCLVDGGICFVYRNKHDGSFYYDLQFY